MMTRTTKIPALLCVGALAAAAAGPSPAGASYRGCGHVKLDYDGFYSVPVEVNGIRCRKGRSLARGWFRKIRREGNQRSVRVQKYRCIWRVHTTNKVTCSRHGRRARFPALD